VISFLTVEIEKIVLELGINGTRNIYGGTSSFLRKNGRSDGLRLTWVCVPSLIKVIINLNRLLMNKLFGRRTLILILNQVAVSI